jgi:hypothetical protein
MRSLRPTCDGQPVTGPVASYDEPPSDRMTRVGSSLMVIHRSTYQLADDGCLESGDRNQDPSRRTQNPEMAQVPRPQQAGWGPVVFLQGRRKARQSHRPGWKQTIGGP